MQRYIGQAPTFVSCKHAEYAGDNAEYLKQFDAYHGAGIGVRVAVLVCVGANAVMVRTQSGVGVLEGVTVEVGTSAVKVSG